MDGHAALLWTAIAAQLYSAVNEVRSLLLMGADDDNNDDDDVVTHLQTLSTNTIGAISTLLTVVHGAQLRRTKQSLNRVERSLGTAVATGIGHADTGTGRRHVRAWSTLAVCAFGYLKYGQLIETRGTAGNPYAAAAGALVCTVSAAGNYYVTVMFVEHVVLANRVLYKLNVQIMDTLGSVSASFLAGLVVSKARLAYLDICDGCATVTRVFQTQLFINIVGNVFGVTFMVLAAFNTLMSDGAQTIRITLYFLYDSLMRTLQMYFIIDACHTTVEQANLINITFQKKINEYYQINFTKRKVQLFILEMLDHKIQFIIYGFICLDFEMFVSIMGTIATYLLILVQLGSSPNALEKTLNMTSLSSNSSMLNKTRTPLQWPKKTR